MQRKVLKIITMLAIVFWSSLALAANTYQYGGINYSTGASLGGATGASTFWATEPTWQVLNSETGYKEGIIRPEVAFAGNAAYPGAYWAKTNDYLYFRVRTEYTGAVTYGSTFHDTAMVMINTRGYNYNAMSAVWGPDFAFSWDSSASPVTEHGLEMQVRSDTGQGSWGAIRFDDLDRLGNQALVPSGPYSFGSQGNGSSKKYSSETSTKGPDFGLLDGSGYVRTVDGIDYSPTGGAPTADSTFIDFAISIAYLNNIAPQLMANPVWDIQFGSISNSNDHALLSDVAGGAKMNESTYAGAVNTLNGTTVPVPPALLLLGSGLIGLLTVRRKLQK